MSSRNPIAAVTGFFDLLGSAIAASAAVRNHRRPEGADLRRLGFDPVQFNRIRNL